MKNGITLVEGVAWAAAWLGFMLLYTLADVAVWRKIAPSHARHLNLISMILCAIMFLSLLKSKTRWELDLWKGCSPTNVLLAVGCAGLFYFLLDRGLDPVLERFFPASEESYQDTLQSLRQVPVISFLQICVLAPMIEEILMRGFLLDGLAVSYGKGIALAVSSALFALFHFNMVQTLSALICGLLLGLLYLHTDSLLCCAIAHMGYNLISFITMMKP